MPIEIRELIIKTEIIVNDRSPSAGASARELNAFRKQILEECKRLVTEKVSRKTYKR